MSRDTSTALHPTAQRTMALIAVVFGIVTIFAGSRVLAGADPGYLVFRPLLWFNTIMGAAYVAAGIAIWRSVSVGRRAAIAITGLNVLVLGAIGYLFATDGPVAIDSVRAMTFRAGVWLLLSLGLVWIGRARR